MNISEQAFGRAQEVLFGDKIKSPTKLKEILGCEIEYLLKQYFEIAPNSYKSFIAKEKDGTLNIEFSFRALRVLLKHEVN